MGYHFIAYKKLLLLQLKEVFNQVNKIKPLTPKISITTWKKLIIEEKQSLGK
jgi:hypothetical protein